MINYSNKILIIPNLYSNLKLYKKYITDNESTNTVTSIPTTVAPTTVAPTTKSVNTSEPTTKQPISIEPGVYINDPCIFTIRGEYSDDLEYLTISFCVIGLDYTLNNFDDLLKTGLINDVSNLLLKNYEDINVTIEHIDENEYVVYSTNNNDIDKQLFLKDYYDSSLLYQQVNIKLPAYEYYWINIVWVISDLYWHNQTLLDFNDYLTLNVEQTASINLYSSDYNNVADIEISSDKLYWFKLKPYIDTDYNTHGYRLTPGYKYYLRGYNPNGISSNNYTNNIEITGIVKLTGNIMTLIDYTKNINQIPSSYCFKKLFYNSLGIVSIPSFNGIKLTEHCFEQMFAECSFLEDIKVLPALDLAPYCYKGMFSSCVNLSEVPSGLLPATVLQQGCYEDMFTSCITLESSPYLKANNLVSDCYKNMFNNCKKLNYIYATFITQPSQIYTEQWVENVAETGTFVKNNNTEWKAIDNVNINAIPLNWIVEDNNATINLYYIE